ncbi:MAG: hypothetical protein VX438_09395, partial [Planctomycetota bacterium]|nr:hypothetical protein [Planctomycetota bacterium]
MKPAMPLALLTLVNLLAVQGVAQQVPLHGESVIEFATIERSSQVLTRDDWFIQSLSKFDLQSRIQAPGDLTTEHYFEFVKKHIVRWKPDEIEKLTAAIQSASEKMKPYRIPFPQKIFLVATDGKEEGGAAYCRGNAVVLPRSMVSGRRVSSLEKLLIHELFHVLSNQNAEVRKELYAIIGFQPCGEIKLPQAFADKKITNPDGPTIDYYVNLKVDGNVIPAVPLVLAKSDYDLKKGGSFFSYLELRLMAIQKNHSGWVPRGVDGAPQFFD